MGKIVVHIQLPLVAPQVTLIDVSFSRMKKAKDVTIFQYFDIEALHVGPFFAQNTELKGLDELDRKIQRECPNFTFEIV